MTLPRELLHLSVETASHQRANTLPASREGCGQRCGRDCCRRSHRGALQKPWVFQTLLLRPGALMPGTRSRGMLRGGVGAAPLPRAPAPPDTPSPSVGRILNPGMFGVAVRVALWQSCPRPRCPPAPRRPAQQPPLCPLPHRCAGTAQPVPAAPCPQPAAQPVRGRSSRATPCQQRGALQRPFCPALSEGPLCPGSYGAFLSPRPPPGGSGQLRPHRSRGSAAAHRARCAELCCPLPGRAVLAGSGAARGRCLPRLFQSGFKTGKTFVKSGREKGEARPRGAPSFLSSGLRASGCVLRAPAGARRVGARGCPGVSRRCPSGYRDGSLPV